MSLLSPWKGVSFFKWVLASFFGASAGVAIIGSVVQRFFLYWCQLSFGIEGQGICFHPQISVLLLDQRLVQEESFLFCRPNWFSFSFSVKGSSFCQISSSVCRFSVEELRVFLAHSVVHGSGLRSRKWFACKAEANTDWLASSSVKTSSSLSSWAQMSSTNSLSLRRLRKFEIMDAVNC